MGMEDPLQEQRELIDALASVLGEEGAPASLFETHISWVLVAGKSAYKFKKAVRFDFVDYSTPALRRFYCEEELRLNRRLAPQIYQSVVAVTGSPDMPTLEVDGEGKDDAVEYAVKMHAFEQQALWTYRVENQLVTPDEIDQLAMRIARFHQNAAVAPKDSAWATPEALRAGAAAVLDAIGRLVSTDEERHAIDTLRRWDGEQERKWRDTLLKRKEQGFIRECHGDLHAGNILTINGRIEVFDCIEFNESLRWIDVINEIAFACMDLEFRQRADLAARLANGYLEATGDYGGLAVLRYYEVRRALVRSMVALLRAAQLDTPEADRYDQLGKDYLKLALSGIRPVPSALMITHGFSGCGKTTLSRIMVELAGAIQIRSDVERKRLHGLRPTERVGAGARIYDAAASRATYEHLRALARLVIEAGRPVIVDAAFLAADQRALFKSLASELHVPFLILDIRTDEATMQKRIAARQALGQDASDAGLGILLHQLAHHDPLSAEELAQSIAIDGKLCADPEGVRKACARALDLVK